MALKKAYYTANNRIIGEKSAGENRLDYVRDQLGSVVATSDSTGSVERTYRYRPYGDVLAGTGAGNVPSFKWVGQLGYRDGDSDVYVRMRHYRQSVGAWITTDPLWPHEPPYRYASADPISVSDPSGLFGIVDRKMCGKEKIVEAWPDRSDVLSIASGLIKRPRFTVLDYKEAVSYCLDDSVRIGKILVINGSFFFRDKPGGGRGSGLPLARVKDCKGYESNGVDKYEDALGKVLKFGTGEVHGRNMYYESGKCYTSNIPGGQAARTVVNGRSGHGSEMMFYVVPPKGFNAMDTCKCFSTQPTSNWYNMDGGSSSQMHTWDPVTEKWKNWSGQTASVNNWFWIGEPLRCDQEVLGF